MSRMRIRIVCKRPPQPERVPGSPFRVAVWPSWYDVEVYAVDEAGVEHPIHDARAVTFSVREGEEANATITFGNVEAGVKPPPKPERAHDYAAVEQRTITQCNAMCDGCWRCEP